jgi:hypothetical protein
MTNFQKALKNTAISLVILWLFSAILTIEQGIETWNDTDKEKATTKANTLKSGT